MQKASLKESFQSKGAFTPTFVSQLFYPKGQKLFSWKAPFIHFGYPILLHAFITKVEIEKLKSFNWSKEFSIFSHQSFYEGEFRNFCNNFA